MQYFKVTINGHRERRFSDKVEAEKYACYWNEQVQTVKGDINLYRI